MNICVEGLGLAVISGESLLGVGDIKSSINSSFQGSEHLSSSRGPGKTNIQTSSECSWTIIVVLHTVHVSINVGVSRSIQSLFGCWSWQDQHPNKL